MQNWPGIEGFESAGRGNVVDEDAAVCAAVEGDAQGLETLLAGRVPDLHGHQTVVDHNLKKIKGKLKFKTSSSRKF